MPKRSPDVPVSVVKKEIAEFERLHKEMTGPEQEGERQKIACQIKMLRSVARLIDDFYGDTNV
jgi:hypothetical protein